MNQEYLVVPNSNDRIYDGSVVILQRLPNLRWVVHNGFYTYNGTTQNGWYLSSVPSQTNMPLFHNDLYGIRILSSDPCPCPPPLPPGPHPPFPPHPVPPFPPGPGPETIQYTKADKLMVDRSMITVPNLEERDKLMSSELIDGKVVRVNDFEGRVEYFEWDKENLKWNLLSLGERYPDADTIASTYATIETVNDLASTVVANTDRIEDLEGTTTQILSDLDTITTNITNIENNITDLDGRVEAIEVELEDFPQWLYLN